MQKQWHDVSHFPRGKSCLFNICACDREQGRRHNYGVAKQQKQGLESSENLKVGLYWHSSSQLELNLSQHCPPCPWVENHCINSMGRTHDAICGSKVAGVRDWNM